MTSLLKRLVCLVTDHDPWFDGGQSRIRSEWQFASRIVWIETCSSCGLQVAEGNSDSWIVPDWVARYLIRRAVASIDWIVTDVTCD